MTPINLVFNNIILLIVFFIIYSVLYYINKNNFKGANDYFDLFYFTTTTQSSTGYGDIVPNTRIAKMTTSIHHIFVIFIFSQYVYNLVHT